MDETFKNRVISWFTMFIIAVIVIGGMMIVYPKYCRNRELKHREQERKDLIEVRNREIARLRENQRRFKSDRDFVEMIARQNRRVFPGELIFILDK